MTQPEPPPEPAAGERDGALVPPEPAAGEGDGALVPPEPAGGEGDGALVPLDPPPGRTQWTFGHAGRVYAVFDTGGGLLVTDNACPHNGGPLADGLVRDGVLTCPWHWYRYELATGRCRTAAGYRLRRYPVVYRGGRPYVALPAAAPAGSWSEILRRHARDG